MSLPLTKFSAFFYFFLSLVALFMTIGLAVFYKNGDNPDTVLFILRPDTYNNVFPFLLGTVAAGGFALAYSIARQSQERILEQQRVAKNLVDRRVQRLQEIYETTLSCFQNIKLQRRRLRGALILDKSAGSWQMRRGLFEEVVMMLNEAQLAGERIMKTFDFEHDNLKSTFNLTKDEIERIKKLHGDLRSQIGGIQGDLRNVLKTAELIGITEGTSNEEDLVNIPDDFIKFANSDASGNLSIRKIAEYFDAFAIGILKRIRELELESDSYGEI